ncbi:hypothetical protein [Plantactinospora endophytica]|uniref:Uncharacterized protein n=1 Tax=Plantactinospora endophytica TaxID=673535 RepID=A0ABQ4EDX9_9ACTN|nr:hypothetical protein Pen02_78740 [Plantactinospora endophytica]
MASVVGVAATGVVLARAERRRRAYTPEQIRDRLRERHADAVGGGISPTGPESAGPNKTQTSQ